MTGLRFVLIAVLASGFTAPRPMLGQGNSALKGIEGMKVRINATILEDDNRAGTIAIQGTVFEIRSDSIYLMQGPGKGVRLPLSSVRTLQVHTGKDHGRGASLGALVGAALGALLATSTPVECDGNGYGIDCRNDGSKPTYAEYVWSYAGPLAMLGALVGAVKGYDRWEPVITPRITTSRVTARGVGLRVGLSF